MTRGFLLFQFPFHRDGPCNSSRLSESTTVKFTAFSSLFIGMGLAINLIITKFPDRLVFFQFPFHRDGPCNNRRNLFRTISAVFLSVPFSSGWALQCAAGGAWALAAGLSFSSLFIGMGLAINRSMVAFRDDSDIFQFPFHRDGPCNFQISRSEPDIGNHFQFPFHRDGPCNHCQVDGCRGPETDFQFPFHRDGPCNSHLQSRKLPFL